MARAPAKNKILVIKICCEMDAFQLFQVINLWKIHTSSWDLLPYTGDTGLSDDHRKCCNGSLTQAMSWRNDGMICKKQLSLHDDPNVPAWPSLSWFLSHILRTAETHHLHPPSWCSYLYTTETLSTCNSTQSWCIQVKATLIDTELVFCRYDPMSV